MWRKSVGNIRVLRDTGQDDHAAFDAQAGRFAALDVVLRTVFQKPNFVEKLFFGVYVHKLMKQFYS